MAPRFGTDGLRGVANSELTGELALLLGRAAARRIETRAVLLGRDTRRSGTMLAAALAAGFAAEGVDVVDVGVVPTPGLAWLAAARAMPAAMVSASHNPFYDNGIKLLSAKGTKLAVALEDAIEAELEDLQSTSAPPRRTGADVGTVAGDADAADAYREHLLSCVHLEEPARLRVVCDSAHGAASALAGPVLTRLGVDATIVGAAPNGTNINEGCGSTHAAALAPVVRAARADVGLCFDGDADRLIALDENGAIVDGDQLLCLFAEDLEERGLLDNDAIVVTVMSNLGLRVALEARGIGVVETPLGDRHVVDAMDKNGLVLGGEQSGHLVFAKDATTGDGLLTALKLLELLDRTRVPLSRLAAGAMQRLPQELRTIRVRAPGALAEAASIWQEVAAVQAELAERGRVLVRASGTEPAVRIMVEAESSAAAITAVERLAKAVTDALEVPSS